MTQASVKGTGSTTRLLIGFSLGWAVFALLFFLLFGVLPPGQAERADWYLIAINIIEIIAFAFATVLCFRNTTSAQIISGRGVWLPLGIGMLCFTLGDVFFALWGTAFGLDPEASLGDVFFLASYIFLFIGMFQAVVPRRINLSLTQKLLIGGIGLGGVALAYLLNYQVAIAATPAHLSPAAIVAQAPATPDTAPPVEAPPETAPEIEPDPALEAAPEAAIAEEVVDTAPGWARSLDNLFSPLAGIFGLMYVVGDCLLVVIAATLLVAFWGGRFSQSWKLIAIAAFFLYIADMIFAFYVNRDAYVEGAVWEVFWTFSALSFALGAVIEYEISQQSRRGSRRRA
ncbi:MAG: hypothetical protein AAFR42_04565 [Cyanobacteria bacterium J06628_6]